MATLLRLLPYAWARRGGLAVVLATMALSVGLEVLRPWPMKVLVDQVLDRQPVPAGLQGWLDVLPGPAGVEGLLMWVCVATVGIFLAGAAMNIVSTVAAVTFSQRTSY